MQKCHLMPRPPEKTAVRLGSVLAVSLAASTAIAQHSTHTTSASASLLGTNEALIRAHNEQGRHTNSWLSFGGDDSRGSLGGGGKLTQGGGDPDGAADAGDDVLDALFTDSAAGAGVTSRFVLPPPGGLPVTMDDPMNFQGIGLGVGVTVQNGTTGGGGAVPAPPAATLFCVALAMTRRSRRQGS